MKTAKDILFNYRIQSSPFTEDKMIQAMEEYHQERMREDLLKFIEWFRIEICTEDVPIEDDYFVDKFLNQKP